MIRLLRAICEACRPEPEDTAPITAVQAYARQLAREQMLRREEERREQVRQDHLKALAWDLALNLYRRWQRRQTVTSQAAIKGKQTKRRREYDPGRDPLLTAMVVF